MTDRRTQILDAAARLMVERGFRQTSVDDVIAAAGLAGKAHFYHYFRSKRDLGVAVLDRQFDRFTERGLAILAEPMIAPLDRLHLFIDALVALQVTGDARSGSPFGPLGAELVEVDEGFRARLAQAFARWTAQLEALFGEMGAELVAGADHARLARFVVATLEGALTMSRVTRDVGMLPGLAIDLKQFIGMHLRATARQGNARPERPLQPTG